MRSILFLCVFQLVIFDVTEKKSVRELAASLIKQSPESQSKLETSKCKQIIMININHIYEHYIVRRKRKVFVDFCSKYVAVWDFCIHCDLYYFVL